MPATSRRRLLRSLAVGAPGATAGCLSDGGSPATESSTDTPVGTNLTEWERSTDCVTTAKRDDMDELYDSVISVEEVGRSRPARFAHVEFSALTAAERDILRTVTGDGGYATCDPSPAFGRFVDRVQQRQHQKETTMVYLERNGTYYGLYVEVTDQVCSW
ncbi:hypothetical protein [Halomicrococcus gelatinilyticus]|uniref:hypothetical protein n=1 Tax=Halomicrococcus gelatinilyticus TaxID=1702103 RepID=UPI002E111CEA